MRRATCALLYRSGSAGISIHALLAESDANQTNLPGKKLVFLSTLSLRRATLAGPSGSAFLYNFYPRSPCGERPIGLPSAILSNGFLSTLSLRRATVYLALIRYLINISIHALLAESDIDMDSNFGGNDYISIHALLAESDNILCVVSIQVWGFLSTLSLRRATSMLISLCCGCFDFYPRSPCGERRCYSLRHSTQGWHFYPRSPCGERQRNQHQRKQKDDFYPRSPCGERHILVNTLSAIFEFLSTLSLRRATFSRLLTHHQLAFLSTLSLRRATNARPDIRQPCVISIHALLAESDTKREEAKRTTDNFYPRSPCGERLIFPPVDTSSVSISIHALLAESDSVCSS